MEGLYQYMLKNDLAIKFLNLYQIKYDNKVPFTNGDKFRVRDNVIEPKSQAEVFFYSFTMLKFINYLILKECTDKWIDHINNILQIPNIKIVSENRKKINQLFFQSILNMFDTDYVTREIFKVLKQIKHTDEVFEILKLYNPKTKKKIKLIKSLGIASDQNVFLAEDDYGREWVIKYAEDESMDENENINRIRDEGGTTFEVSNGWHLSKSETVLVMERLLPIDEYDDEYEMGRQLIPQLQSMHKFALHEDLKPDNIMKRNTPNGPLFFIIDMDLRMYSTGISKLGGVMSVYGENIRYISTPLFGPNIQVKILKSTYRDDLFELCYVMNALLLLRKRLLSVSHFTKENIKLLCEANGIEEFKFTDPITFLKINKYTNERNLWTVMEGLLKKNTEGEFPNYAESSDYIDINVSTHVLENYNKAVLENDFQQRTETKEMLYTKLLHILRPSNDRRKALGFHPSDLKPRTINKMICYRCGRKNDKGTHQKDADRGYIFCNSKCQNVFYKFH